MKGAVNWLLPSCEEVGAKSSAWLDDELGWWEGKLVRFHIGRCAMCQGVYDQLRAMKDRLSELGEAGGRPLDPGVRSTLLAEFRGSVDDDR